MINLAAFEVETNPFGYTLKAKKGLVAELHVDIHDSFSNVLEPAVYGLSIIEVDTQHNMISFYMEDDNDRCFLSVRGDVGSQIIEECMKVMTLGTS